MYTDCCCSGSGSDSDGGGGGGMTLELGLVFLSFFLHGPFVSCPEETRMISAK